MRRPRFIAEQARHASGPIGRLIAFVMAHETRVQNELAIEALRVESGDHVLDIGCGPGRGLAALAGKASRGCVVGADTSPLMTEIAASRNRALIRAGRVKVVVAGASELPFPDGAFDKALCVHVVYFWDDLPSHFREIARVLKPGGRLALVFRSTLHEAAVNSFPAEVYRFPDVAEIRETLRSVGLLIETETMLGADADKAPHLLLARRSD